MALKRCILRCTALISAVFLAAFSSGCSGSDTKQKKISFSWWGGQSRHEATMKAVRSFEEKHKDIKIDVKFGAWDGWEDSMTSAFYAGTQTDVIQINWNWLDVFDSGSGLFLDLNTLSDHIDLSGYSASDLAACTFDGELRAVPVSVTGRIFYWNRSVFNKAGLDVPKTLDDLFKAGEVFREKLGDDYYPLALAEYDRMMLMVYYLASVYGKPWILDGKLNYTEDEIQKGVEFIASLEEAHVIPSVAGISGDGAVTFDRSPKWMNGEYAGIFEWDSAASKYQKALENTDDFVVGDYFPDFGKYKGGYSKISVAFAVSKKAEHPEECAEFLDFILNDPEGTVLMGVERGIPLNKNAHKACSAAGLLNGIEMKANEKVLDWADYSLDINFEDPKLKVSPEGVYFDAFSGLSYGEYTAEKTARIISEGVKDVLGRE
ncbi:ABC transporter substrate-binding protein [Ruminococcus sp. HUN007]|uniref:ABC transporter substrate-binding protein n=1 Tax=Ruminococcus sp. HUN007 TaxID=1514668 RepID=UPI000679DFDD|nr:ABC transporter substrate-binding protein [Ruminococcus sp. HUN007]